LPLEIVTELNHPHCTVLSKCWFAQGANTVGSKTGLPFTPFFNI